MPYRIGRLGEVLRLRKDLISIDDTREYKRIRVQLHQRGLLLRDVVPGTAIKTKKQQVVRAGDVLVAEIDAKVGGFGVVPSELDGAIVSSHYFTFEIATDIAASSYVGHLMRWPELAAQVAAQGSPKYAAIRSDDFLSYRVPIPSTIEEQRRVAERLGRVSGRSAELLTRFHRAEELSSALAMSSAARPDLGVAAKLARGWRRMSLGEVMAPSVDVVSVDHTKSYPNAGILSFGRGLFPKPNIEGSRTSAKVLNRIKTGQFIYSRLFAFEGAYAFVGPTFNGSFVSMEFPCFDADATKLNPRWLATYLRAPERWTELAGSSKGGSTDASVGR